jgi:hypothetical protein
MLTEGLGVPKETISVQKCSSLKQQVRYLIHKDQAEKYQFDASEILTNDIETTNEHLSDYLQPTTTLINNWLQNGANKIELFQMIGLKNYQSMTSVINSLTNGLTYEMQIQELKRLVEALREENSFLKHLCDKNNIALDDLPF